MISKQVAYCWVLESEHLHAPRRWDRLHLAEHRHSGVFDEVQVSLQQNFVLTLVQFHFKVWYEFRTTVFEVMSKDKVTAQW